MALLNMDTEPISLKMLNTWAKKSGQDQQRIAIKAKYKIICVGAEMPQVK